MQLQLFRCLLYHTENRAFITVLIVQMTSIIIHTRIFLFVKDYGRHSIKLPSATSHAITDHPSPHPTHLWPCMEDIRYKFLSTVFLHRHIRMPAPFAGSGRLQQLWWGAGWTSRPRASWPVVFSTSAVTAGPSSDSSEEGGTRNRQISRSGHTCRSIIYILLLITVVSYHRVECPAGTRATCGFAWDPLVVSLSSLSTPVYTLYKKVRL